MLTNLESVFRSLKTDIGPRAVYHQVERRVEVVRSLQIFLPRAAAPARGIICDIHISKKQCTCNICSNITIF